MTLLSAIDTLSDLIIATAPSGLIGSLGDFKRESHSPFYGDDVKALAARSFWWRLAGGSTDFDDQVPDKTRRRFADLDLGIVYPEHVDELLLDVTIADDYAIMVEAMADCAAWGTSGIIAITVGPAPGLPYDVDVATLPQHVIVTTRIPLHYTG